MCLQLFVWHQSPCTVHEPVMYEDGYHVPCSSRAFQKSQLHNDNSNSYIKTELFTFER